MEKIPKIIHQIWIGPNKKPDVWMDTFSKEYINSNPDYKYKLWTDSDIDDLFDGFHTFKEIYKMEQTWNGKSDIMRYIILFKHGGIYIDADAVWVNNKSFNYLIDNTNQSGVFLSRENLEKYKGLCGGVIGSTKGNKLMKKLIDGIEYYVKWGDSIRFNLYKRKRKYLGAWSALGPKYLNRKLENENVTVYPTIYFYPISWHFIDNINEHKNTQIPEESYTFQYGYTTKKLKCQIDDT